MFPTSECHILETKRLKLLPPTIRANKSQFLQMTSRKCNIYVLLLSRFHSFGGIVFCKFMSPNIRFVALTGHDEGIRPGRRLPGLVLLRQPATITSPNKCQCLNGIIIALGIFLSLLIVFFA